MNITFKNKTLINSTPNRNRTTRVAGLCKTRGIGIGILRKAPRSRSRIASKRA